MEKKKSHAFGKDVYLLGLINGKMQWLEAPSWDCGWYWDFGYVEEYTRHDKPSASRDIVSHTHVDSLTKGVFHNLGDIFSEGSTFNSDEMWKLAELFKQFYMLRNMAEFAGKEKPNCHITASPVDHGDLKDWSEKINKVMIPAITAEIIKILTPEGE